MDFVDTSLSWDDDYPTPTSSEQLSLETRLFCLYNRWVNSGASLSLLTDVHLPFCLSGLSSLPQGMSALDSSRPWILFWILNAVSLMGGEENIKQVKDDCVAFLGKCQNALPGNEQEIEDAGGFGGGPMQLSHLAPSYASCMSLIILGAYEQINRKAMYAFLLKMKQGGGFKMHLDGESDVRGTYTAIAIASALNLLTPELINGTVEYLKSCQTFEGGFGGEPGTEAHGGYTYCAVASLVLLGVSLESEIDLELLKYWTAKRQGRDGGLQGRTNKLVDACYSFWVGSLSECINKTPNDSLFSAHALERFLLVCCQDSKGGLIDKPGKPRDFYHTAYALSGLSVSIYAQGQNSIGTSPLKKLNVLYNVEETLMSSALAYFYK